MFDRAPLVSVVLLTYNHERYLSDAIEGVLKQDTDFPLELLIAEDCSTDKTREICRMYQRRYPAIVRVITGPKNVGAVPNLLRAFRYMRGEYVAICEGDDYWTDPRKLSVQVAALSRRPDIDLCCHSCMYRFDEDQTLHGPHMVAAGHDYVIPLGEVIAGDGGKIATASIVVRRAVIEVLPGWLYEAPIGDYALQCYGARRGGALYINRAMSVYRVALPGSWTGTVERDEQYRSAVMRRDHLILRRLEEAFSEEKVAFRRLILFRYNWLCSEGLRLQQREVVHTALEILRMRSRDLPVRLWLIQTIQDLVIRSGLFRLSTLSKIVPVFWYIRYLDSRLTFAFHKVYARFFNNAPRCS